MCSRPRSICLVADSRDLLSRDADGLPALAARLRASGCAVQILDCGTLDPATVGQVANVHGPCPSDHADAVLHALQPLHKKHAFDRIEFPALAGLGFRAVQAKRAGLAFTDVPLAVRLDATSAWLREQRQQWPNGVKDLELDFIERLRLRER